MIRHFGGQALKLDHTLRLQILNGIIELLMVRLWRGPGHEDVFEDLQHETRVLI